MRRVSDGDGGLLYVEVPPPCAPAGEVRLRGIRIDGGWDCRRVGIPGLVPGT